MEKTNLSSVSCRRRDIVTRTVKRPLDHFKSVPSSALLAHSCLSSLRCGSAGSLLSLKAVLLEQVKVLSRCLTSLVGLQVNFGRKEKVQTLLTFFLEVLCEARFRKKCSGFY